MVGKGELKGRLLILVLCMVSNSCVVQLPEMKPEVTVGPIGETISTSVHKATASGAERFQVATVSPVFPFYFEENQGQVDESVKYLARGRGYTVLLTPSETVLSLLRAGERASGQMSEPWKLVSVVSSQLSVFTPPFLFPDPSAQILNPNPQLSELTHPLFLRVTLTGAAAHPQLAAEESLPGKVNYFIGNEPSKWRTEIPTYGRVRYHDVYPGIDVAYYGRQRELEYDFVVQPGADPRQIRMRFAGAEDLKLDPSGDVILYVPGGEVRLLKPQIYQEIYGKKQTVQGRYRLLAEEEVDLVLSSYDATKPLIIDPVLSYATYLGGVNNGGNVNGVAADSVGNMYVTGSECLSNNVNPCPSRAFVTKLAAQGTLDYTTYLGGGLLDNSRTEALAIAVNGAGDAHVVGYTTSTLLPTSPRTPISAVQLTHGGGGDDGFIIKLNTTGSQLLYATYLGGNSSDRIYSVAVNGAGHAYVTGTTSSDNFVTTQGVIQFSQPCCSRAAFVTRLNEDGTQIVYSTYLGGSFFGGAIGRGIALDSGGNAYVAGGVSVPSPSFPVTQEVFQPQPRGDEDAFVIKLNFNATRVLYGTYLGGPAAEENATGIAVDSFGNAYITGRTPGSFPVTPGAFPPPGGFSGMPFVAKLDNEGRNLVYSTYLGGSLRGPNSINRTSGIAVDGAGNATVVGGTDASDFPTQDPVQATAGGFRDAFITQFSPTGTLRFSTYLGGSGSDSASAVAIDRTGVVYVAGQGDAGFPITPDALPQGVPGSFIAKILPIGTLAVVPLSLAFGEITLGAGRELVFDVANTGRSTITGTITTTAAGFSIVNGGGAFNLMPSDPPRRVTVRFTPPSAGNFGTDASFGGLINVASSGGNVGVIVTGTGIAQPGALLTVCGQQLDFGEVLINTTALLTCIVRSGSGFPLTIAVNGTGMSLKSAGNVTLNPGQSHTAELQLTPRQSGPVTGSLTVASAGLSTTVVLTGVGRSGPILDANPPALRFGGVPVGQSRELPVTVRNVGDQALSRYLCSPAGFSVLADVSLEPLLLTPGAQQVLRVRFTPSNVSFSGYNGTLLFSSTRCDSPVVDQAKVGVSGNGVAADGRGVAYVVNQGEGTVSVVDLQLGKEVQVITVGRAPVDGVLSPDGQRFYVVNSADNNVSVIDTATQRVVGQPLAVGLQPVAATFAPDGKRLYVVNRAEQGVAIIDATKDEVNAPNYPVLPAVPTEVVVSPDGGKLYVLGTNDNQIDVIDTETLVPTHVEVGSAPLGIAFAADGREAYVADERSTLVTVLDATKTPPNPVRTLAVGAGQRSIAVSLAGKVYVAGTASETITILPEGKKVSVGSGYEVSGLELTDDGQRLLVVAKRRQGGPGQVTVLRVSDDSVGVPIPVGIEPEGGALNTDPQQPAFIVRNEASNSISVVSLNNAGSVEIPVGETPVAVAVAVTAPPAACTYTLGTPTQSAFGSSGGTGKVTVNTEPRCGWRVRSSVPVWLTVSGAIVRQGPGEVTFVVDANRSGSARSGKLVVMGQEVTINQAGGSSTRTVPRDANGDGKSDLVWRHSSGITSLWLLNGGALLQPPLGLAVMPSSQWEVVSTGDFNGDGKSDLVWRHSSGVTYLWLLNGGTLVQNPIGLAVMPSSQWEVVSTGDFNGDGKSDLVWRHSSGVTYLWLMNGGTLLQQPLGLAVMPSSQWEVVSTGDFNGDNKSDLVWRHSSGITYLWLLNGGTLLQPPLGLAVMPSSQWEVVSTGDFNGDGKSDLVWRHSSGITSLWLLNGGTLVQQPIGLAVMPSSQWEVLTTGDFNGDGRCDLIWRHSSGVTYLWLLNGGTLVQNPIGLAVMPSGQWEVLGQN
jgi:YVTN family beta-propeller protein